MENAEALSEVATPAPAPASVQEQRVLVTGATGFIGSHTCRALTVAGYEVVGLVRKPPPEADAIPGVSYITGDLKDASTLSPEMIAGCHGVVHLAGIIVEVHGKGQTFEAIHVDGTRNLVAMARSVEDLGRFVYVSAQGASPEARSEYARTKARAEQIVRDSGLPYTIFRPSLVLGPGGDFVTRIEALIRRPPLSPVPLPFIPVPGSGAGKFQPVFVEDLTTCIVRSLAEPAARDQTFEIGGADVVTFNEMIEAFERHAGVKKPLLHVPMPVMFAASSVLEALLPVPPITVDQLQNLSIDNVCDNEAVQQTFGIHPLPFEQALARI